MKDTQILDLYWARKEQAITETQQAYEGYCYSIAWHILYDREDSDECVNDTWLRAWNAIPPKRPGKLSLFLGTITRNLALDRWKKRHTVKRGGGEMTVALDELAECVPAAVSTEDVVEAAELERLLNVFLRTLSRRDCDIFLRRPGSRSWGLMCPRRCRPVTFWKKPAGRRERRTLKHCRICG